MVSSSFELQHRFGRARGAGAQYFSPDYLDQAVNRYATSHAHSFVCTQLPRKNMTMQPMLSEEEGREKRAGHGHSNVLS
jgi:hypothetical protein